MTLDPQIAELIQALDAGIPAVHTMTGAQARATIRSRFVAPAQPEAVGRVDDRHIPGPDGDIAVRIYRPSGSAPDGGWPIVVFAHGGGWVFCDLDSHDGLCRSFTNQMPAVVISVAYRLAPEHPWPAAADDMYAAFEWAVENAVSIGGCPDHIVVAGDSAGGNLAAVTALMARDRSDHRPAAQLLLYPVIAADFGTESYRLFGSGYYNPQEAMQWYWDQYVPNAAERSHPYASPLHADLRGVAPTIIAINGCDPLRDEMIAYADALTAAGVHVVRCDYEGGIHGFMTMPMLDLAQEARRRVCRELTRLLAGAQSSTR